MSAPFPSPEEARARFHADVAAAERQASASAGREASASAGGGLSPADVQELRVRWLGKKQGVLTDLLGRLREVPKEEKAAFGAAVNALKREVEEALDLLEAEAGARAARAAEEARAVDVTLPARPWPAGRLHPLTVVRRRLEETFRRLGYDVADGPEIESDWYNFEALNFPPDHLSLIHI